MGMTRAAETGESHDRLAGSVAGTVVGGLLLGVLPSTSLILVALLLVSAVKVWRHS
jgi:hypothetical protein